MMEVEFGGVTEAIANLTERGAVDPVVKATLTLSESGFVSVSDAVAFGEIKDESLTGKCLSNACSVVDYSYFSLLIGKIKGLFGAGSSSSDDATAESAENTPPRDTESASASASSSSSAASASATPEKKAPVENTISLTIENKFTTIPPMTVEEKRKSRSR